jgi:hypothetical protein
VAISKLYSLDILYNEYNCIKKWSKQVPGKLREFSFVREDHRFTDIIEDWSILRHCTLQWSIQMRTERRHIPDDGKPGRVLVRKPDMKQVLDYRTFIRVSHHCALIRHTKAIYIYIYIYIYIHKLGVLQNFVIYTCYRCGPFPWQRVSSVYEMWFVLAGGTHCVQPVGAVCVVKEESVAEENLSRDNHRWRHDNHGAVSATKDRHNSVLSSSVPATGRLCQRLERETCQNQEGYCRKITQIKYDLCAWVITRRASLYYITSDGKEVRLDWNREIKISQAYLVTNHRRLECDADHSVRNLPTFRRYILPSCSG